MARDALTFPVDASHALIALNMVTGRGGGDFEGTSLSHPFSAWRALLRSCFRSGRKKMVPKRAYRNLCRLPRFALISYKCNPYVERSASSSDGELVLRLSALM